MKWRIMYLLMAVFVLIVGVAFAWMDFSEEHVGGFIVYQYGSGTDYYMGVTNTNFHTELQVLNGEVYEPVDSADALALNGMVPSQSINFKFKFTNNSIDEVIGDYEGTPVKVNVYLTGITAESRNDAGMPKLSEVLYFAITESEGYAADSVNRPTNMLASMQSMLEPETFDENGNALTYRALLLENLVIPVGTEASPNVSIFCYFLFDRDATIEYENCDIEFDNILVAIAQ